MPIVGPTNNKYEGPEIPDGLYILTCMDVLEEERKNDKGVLEPKFRLVLEGQLPNGDLFSVDPIMNKTWSAIPNRTPSTLYTYAVALGCNADPQKPFNTDDLIEKQLEALIRTDEAPGSWPRIKEYNRIKGARATVLPTRAPAGSAKASEVFVNDTAPSREDMLSAFWARMFAAGLTRAEVIEKAGGDVTHITGATQEFLDGLLAELGA